MHFWSQCLSILKSVFINQDWFIDWLFFYERYIYFLHYLQILEENIGYLVGDCLIAAAFLSYAGPFLSNYRDELVEKTWLAQVMLSCASGLTPKIVGSISLICTVAFVKWFLPGSPCWNKMKFAKTSKEFKPNLKSISSGNPHLWLARLHSFHC